MKLNEIDLKKITIIQLLIASTISLLYQFVFPYTWQPLEVKLLGSNVRHGDPGTNIVICTISLWYFTLSIAWFIYRDNIYLNNFLVYSLVPMSLVLIAEFFWLHLYYDYLHILPFIISIYIFIKKRDMIYQRSILFIIPFLSIWLFTAYFLKLAYYNDTPIQDFLVNYSANIFLSIALSFCFKKKREKNSKI
ncbi:MAG: hypothetical protein ACTSVV_15775 [Promethearchaeota archaeon]